MIPQIDFRQLEFYQPGYLWLLVLPALLLTAWMWRLAARRADTRGLKQSRLLPVRERFALAGDLPFWLCLIFAMACAIVAVARPHGPAKRVKLGGIDAVIIADGSASMRVKDTSAGDRWQRAMQFVRFFGDSLAWKDDRVAMSVFAHIATPQVRLTKDPNTFFFFLDHLAEAPPFRIEDNTTWDTNLELAVYWGLRVMEKDEELHGKNQNAKLFVLLTDGQAWSGEVAKSLRLVARSQIPIFAVGVGSLSGGPLPIVAQPIVDGVAPPPEERLWSQLDRNSLQRVAQATGGEYFELDREGDRKIANAIIDAGKRLAPKVGVEQTAEELYWIFLAAGAAFVGLGMLLVRDRAELWLQVAGTVVIFALLSGVF
jgi:Ca-activated chloride channel family protein